MISSEFLGLKLRLALPYTSRPCVPGHQGQLTEGMNACTNEGKMHYLSQHWCCLKYLIVIQSFSVLKAQLYILFYLSK